MYASIDGNEAYAFDGENVPADRNAGKKGIYEISRKGFVVDLCHHNRGCRNSCTHFGVAVILVPIIVVSAFVDTSTMVLVINLAVLFAIEWCCIPIAIHNFVEVQNEALLVVFGFIKRKIPYKEIVALSTTHNPLSSLAASFDRIEIKCENRSTVMIAVVDKEGFFNELKKRNAHIFMT